MFVPDPEVEKVKRSFLAGLIALSPALTAK
jgi:hypothetical protein